MKTGKIVMPLLASVLMLAGLITGKAVFADENEKGERREREERGGRYTVPENALYTKECSSCHFLFLPGLLPARSWEEVMRTSDKHFGEDLALDEKTKDEILSFLTANSAEKSDTEWSGKILDSIGREIPTRITEVPYMVQKHRKIDPEVFKRESIKSFSNCGACHTRAVDGEFEERGVSIPK